jgi:hypothetical protein
MDTAFNSSVIGTTMLSPSRGSRQTTTLSEIMASTCPPARTPSSPPKIFNVETFQFCWTSSPWGGEARVYLLQTPRALTDQVFALFGKSVLLNRSEHQCWHGSAQIWGQCRFPPPWDPEHRPERPLAASLFRPCRPQFRLSPPILFPFES